MFRYSDTEKWDKEWFQKLSSNTRDLFDYLWNKCNWGGFWRINKRTILFQMNISENHFKKSLEELKQSQIFENDGWIWIPDFLKHQNKLPLKQNNFHNHIRSKVEEQLIRFPDAQHILTNSLHLITMPNQTEPKLPPAPAKSPSTTAYYDEIINGWNKFADDYGFSKIVSLSSSRKEKIRTRFKDPGGKFDFKEIMKKISQSSFLQNPTISKGRSWVLTFDWIIKNDENYIKILEGNYDDRERY